MKQVEFIAPVGIHTLARVISAGGRFGFVVALSPWAWHVGFEAGKGFLSINLGPLTLAGGALKEHVADADPLRTLEMIRLKAHPWTAMAGDGVQMILLDESEREAFDLALATLRRRRGGE